MKGAMDDFRKHMILFRAVGIHIDDGSIRNKILKALIFSQFFVAMFVIWYQHVICLFLGGLWLGGRFTMREKLIVFCSTFTGITAAMKLYMLLRNEKDLAYFISELKGFRPKTSMGKYTRWLTYVYECMAVYFNITLITMDVRASPDLSLPFPIWHPFEINSQLKRTFTFFLLHLAAAYVWLCMVLTDTFLLHLVNQLCDRFRTLDHTFRLAGLTMEEKESKIASEPILKLESYEDEDLVKSCIVEHLLLLRLRDMIGDMLNETFLYQVVNSMSVLMAVFYIFTNSEDILGDALGFSGVLVVDIVQVLTSCMSGELLKLKSEGIHFAVYNSNWYDCSPKTKTTLLVVSTYASQEVVLKGSFVFNLSLQTYETFVRQSFSIFTVMYQFI